mmetsp:Transcript_22144/g.40238  ORF Transcript_22144/g.40238 Transcript_22144/m.40238 type:complete len:113 (-) Transcript_22144:752-1090(-)
MPSLSSRIRPHPCIYSRAAESLAWLSFSRLRISESLEALGGDKKRDVSSADLYVVLTTTFSCSVSFSNHALHLCFRQNRPFSAFIFGAALAPRHLISRASVNLKCRWNREKT